MSLYFFLNLSSLFIPFIYSFDKRMNYVHRWKSILPSIFITAFFYIVWDILFTKLGVWSFNPRYHSGIEFFDLPIEEWLFFICIPYSSLFLHFVLCYFFPNTALSNKNVKIIYFCILLLCLPVTILNYQKLYTSVSLSVLILLLTYTVYKVPNVLNTFFLSFLIILIPFFLVNGILTGSFIDEPVVVYNNNENLGIRIGTVPVEDIGYGFSMLLMSLVLINKFENSLKQ